MAQKTLPKEFYQLMEEYQQVSFVLVELTLYLDTHPNDLDAVKQFNSFAKKMKMLKQQIEEKYGPLQQFGNSYTTFPWAWADPPWPWQL